MRHTAYEGKHKILDHWEDIIYEVVDQPFKNASFQDQTIKGYNRVTMVHRNLLLPLLSNPLIHAGEPNNNRSLADPKETMDIQVAIVASAIASHVHNLGAYEGVQVTILIKKGLKFVTTVFWKY